MGFDVTYTCDVCGRRVDDDEVVTIKYHPRRGRWETWEAHRKCAKPIHKAIKEIVINND